MGNHMRQFFWVAAFCFASSVALAQTDPGFFPSGTVLGNNTGSSARPGAISSVVLNQSAGASQRGFNITQPGPTTGTLVAPGDSLTNSYGYNNIVVLADQRNDSLSVSANPVTYGLSVSMSTGGGSSQGQKIAIGGLARRDTADSGPQWDVIGVNGNGFSFANDGGTNTGAGARGTAFGYGGAGVLWSGATNHFLVSGGELDVAIHTGASSRYRIGISTVDTGNLQAADGIYDVGFAVGAIAGAPGFKYGLLFSSLNGGVAPVTDTYIASDPNLAMNVAYGVNFSNTNFSVAAFATSQYSLLPDGTTILAKNAAIPAGGTAGLGLKFSTTANFGVFFGSGAATLSAAQGSLYLRSDGSTITRASINTNGTTGWITLISADVVAVASLPTCNAGAEGARLGVNNSNAASFTAGIGTIVAAGGTTHVPVYCDGTNWRIG